MNGEAFDFELPALLEPATGEPPCGPSLRYELAYLSLRQSREEDDPSLPMRDWSRPLKKADWRAVSRSCRELLARSKDLQLAAWLADAWLRQHQVQGLIAGAALLSGLVDQFWDGLHPALEAGDSDARTAPFVWLNENIPLVLRLQVPLVFITDRKPPYLPLADWERISVPQPVREGQEPEEPEFTRETLLAMVEGGGVRWLRQLREEARDCAAAWDALARKLDERLGAEAPSLGKIVETLRRIERACTSLIDGRGEPAPPQPEPVPRAIPTLPPEDEPMSNANAAAPVPALDISGPITSREEAYRVLEAAAAYLQRTEPHSPTPYLVKRAIAWGQLSLPELMQEVLREEGDLGRFFSMLGIPVARD